MKIKTVVFAALAAALACGCAHEGLKSVSEKGELAPKFEDTKLDGKYLWVRGIGAANPEHLDKTQRRAMSREAAIANAYQRALEYVKGAGVISNVRVADAIASDSAIETRVAGVIRGGEVFESEYLDGDGCAVKIRISRDAIKAMNISLPD